MVGFYWLFEKTMSFWGRRRRVGWLRGKGELMILGRVGCFWGDDFFEGFWFFEELIKRKRSVVWDSKGVELY